MSNGLGQSNDHYHKVETEYRDYCEQRRPVSESHEDSGEMLLPRRYPFSNLTILGHIIWSLVNMRRIQDEQQWREREFIFNYGYQKGFNVWGKPITEADAHHAMTGE